MNYRLVSLVALVAALCSVAATQSASSNLLSAPSQPAARSQEASRSQAELRHCARNPIGIMRHRSLLSFVTSDMPDPALNDRPAVTETFDIMPDYGNLPPCPDIVRGAVLVAGISNLAQVSFDLTGYQPGPDELDTGNLNEFSVAEALAWRNVFVVLVNPFGYGESQFDDNGAQPTQLQCNTSRQGFLPDGGCNSPAGCDRTGGGAGSGDRSFPAGLQTSELGLNPECAHTTNARFTNTRGFARSVHQAVLHAKALSGVGKVSMWGWSAGGVTVAYYARRTTVIDGMNTADNVDRIVLHASAYNTLMPSDGERPERPADGYFYPTFPITVRGFSTPTGEPAAWGGFPEATAATCPGQYTKTFAPIREHLWLRNMEDEPVSSSWGKNGAWDPLTNPHGGRLKYPTFTHYGLNAQTVGEIDAPVLILHGVADPVEPPVTSCKLFTQLQMSRISAQQLFVLFDCASHFIFFDTCYDPADGSCSNWRGPHQTLQDGVAEWIIKGTFQGFTDGLTYVTGVNQPDPPGTLVGACDMCYNITHDVHDCTCADGCTPPAPGPLLRRQ